MKALAKTFIPTVQLFFGKIQLLKNYVAKISFPKIYPVYENPGRTRILPNALYFSEFCAQILHSAFYLAIGILLSIKLGITWQSAFLLGITWQQLAFNACCMKTRHKRFGRPTNQNFVFRPSRIY